MPLTPLRLVKACDAIHRDWLEVFVEWDWLWGATEGWLLCHLGRPQLQPLHHESCEDFSPFGWHKVFPKGRKSSAVIEKSGDHAMCTRPMLPNFQVEEANPKDLADL